MQRGKTGRIDIDTVSLNLEINLSDMKDDDEEEEGDDSKKFVITGALDDIKLTNENDFDLLDGGLKSMNMRLDSKFEFDVKFVGEGKAEFGFFDKAWEEVEEQSLFLANLKGLGSGDKKG